MYLSPAYIQPHLVRFNMDGTLTYLLPNLTAKGRRLLLGNGYYIASRPLDRYIYEEVLYTMYDKEIGVIAALANCVGG